MMNSLETRSPFLDIELVDFVRKIPAAYKFRRGKTKYILKASLKGILPEFIINRDKQGFGVPIGSWFRDGHLKIDNLENNLNNMFLSKKIAEHRRKKIDHKAYLWNTWVYENFLRYYKVNLSSRS